jgi:hypothetical protein
MGLHELRQNQVEFGDCRIYRMSLKAGCSSNPRVAIYRLDVFCLASCRIWNSGNGFYPWQRLNIIQDIFAAVKPTILLADWCVSQIRLYSVLTSSTFPPGLDCLADGKRALRASREIDRLCRMSPRALGLGHCKKSNFLLLKPN